MTDMRIAPRVTPAAATADNGWIAAQGLRDGSMSVVDALQRLALAGRGFVASMGSVTTPLTFLVTAANRPDAWIRVPSGTTIIPISWNIALEAFAGTVTEIDIRIAQNDIGNGTSSAATAGPINLRTDVPLSSNCTARQLATGDTTAETNPVSVFRKTIPAASAAANDIAAMTLWEPKTSPVLVGPATIEAYIAATTTQATGFVVVQWVEIPSNWIT